MQTRQMTEAKVAEIFRSFLNEPGKDGVVGARVYNFPIERLEALGLTKRDLRIVDAMRPKAVVDSAAQLVESAQKYNYGD